MAQSVNWDEWESEIHTAGVVNKIRGKYEGFMRAEYNVEAAVSQVGNVTDKMRQLEVANTYNAALYLAHFIGHLDQIETVRNIGDVTEMSMLELVHMMPGIESL